MNYNQSQPFWKQASLSEPGQKCASSTGTTWVVSISLQPVKVHQLFFGSIKKLNFLSAHSAHSDTQYHQTLTWWNWQIKKLHIFECLKYRHVLQILSSPVPACVKHTNALLCKKWPNSTTGWAKEFVKHILSLNNYWNDITPNILHGIPLKLNRL